MSLENELSNALNETGLDFFNQLEETEQFIADFLSQRGYKLGELKIQEQPNYWREMILLCLDDKNRGFRMNIAIIETNL